MFDVSSPRAKGILGLALSALLVLGHVPTFIIAFHIGPRVAKSLWVRDDLFSLAVYTLLSYCLVFALVVVLALAPSRFACSPRIRRLVTILSVANFFPHFVTIALWGLATSAWID